MIAREGIGPYSHQRYLRELGTVFEGYKKMTLYANPFEYEAAIKLGAEKILDFYISDFNYSRFIRSKRNIFLVGERGSGKSMALLYSSVPVQVKKAERDNEELDLSVVCVHVPCNTVLTHKREYQLLNEFQASIVSEHFLVISIMYAIAAALSNIPNLLEGADVCEVRDEIKFLLDIDLRGSNGILESLALSLQKEIGRAQKAMNSRRADVFYENATSFAGGVLPLLTCLRKIPRLGESHFSLMLDDGHDLNEHQIQSLNSWIAYRDNSLFSFKVASVKVNGPSYRTASGGAILEGHDFTLIDMERPYQNKFSNFGKLADRIIGRRLKNIDIHKTPEEFFPVNAQFKKDMDEFRKLAEAEAKEKFPGGTKKQIGDFVYKYARAMYFRKRAEQPQTNRPTYSGFETIVHLSTGVIRNLLQPCFLMYDNVVSELHLKEQEEAVECVPAKIQDDAIREESRKKWQWINRGLDDTIDDCSREQAKEIKRLFDNLAILFKKRLKSRISEPRAITFTISDVEFDDYSRLEALLTIAQKAQLLYTYVSSAKDYGRRETYYVPNRILWPERGLDPVGQHARVSIKARHLWASASQNKPIPLGRVDNKCGDDSEKGLFDDED